jgi:glutamate N-acetyltransferase/amino-acid N-acetyltransferase
MISVRLSASVLLARGFQFSAAAAGLKRGGGLDLGLVEATAGTRAAAVFTSNRVVAAPVLVGRCHLRAGGGRVRVVMVNSGNANCATGLRGLRDCLRICQRVGQELGENTARVFPSSTGVIGVPLPADRIIAALPRLLAGRRASRAALHRFARAIMTTDTRPKLASARFRYGGEDAVLTGVAKGAGMIHPQLATMLVYLFTDISARPAELRRCLRPPAARTFNRISVDGDTSTNDTVLLLASGFLDHRRPTPADRRHFAAALEAVCASLAEQIISDGEGVRHVVRLHVEGARTEAEAERVARTIANSPLVKTAWAGADPNWGRILAAVGRSGVTVNPKRVDIFLGAQQICRRGAACAFDARRAHRTLSQPRFEVRVRLGRGRAAASFLTCDLTEEYVRVNASYRS